MAGEIDAPGAHLEIRDALKGTMLADVGAAVIVDGSDWRTIEVTAPAGTAVVHARLEDRNRWFAFSEPVETAPLSAWTARLVPQGRVIWQGAAVAGALLWLVTAWLAWRARKALPGRSTSPDTGVRA